jgi:hypothetical protein
MAMRSARVMVSRRNMVWGILPRLVGLFCFLFEAGDGLIDLAQLPPDVLQWINVMNGAQKLVRARSTWKLRHQASRCH